MKKQWLMGCGIVCLSLALAGAAFAAPTITRLEVAGVPQVLRVPVGGFGGITDGTNLGYNTDTNRLHWGDPSSGGFEIAWVDPALYGNRGGSHDSSTGVARNYFISDTYAGTVTGATVATLNSYSLGFAYVPDTQSMFSVGASGNGAPVMEIQAATTVGGGDVVGEGTNASKVNSARLLSTGNPALTTGNFHTGLAYLGSDATNYKFLFIDQIGGASQNGWTMTLSKVYSTPPGATTAGARTLGTASGTVTSAQLGGLVPGVNDYVSDLANDLTGNVYVLSVDGTHNYLSAFSLAAGFTQIDLDPDPTKMFADLGGLVTNTSGGTEVGGNGLAVNGDASKIYIAARDGDGSSLDNIFIFNAAQPPPPVPEPASLGLLLLGLPLVLRRRS